MAREIVEPSLTTQESLLPTALLLAGHGTRSRAGTESFWRLVQLAQQAATARKLAIEVAGGLLELQQPTILDALQNLYATGHRKVAVAPLLLFTAGHAKRDIPEIIASFLQSHPDCQITQGSSWNSSPEVVALARYKLQQTAELAATVDPAETLHLFAGRGSLDADATAEMHRFASLTTSPSIAAEHRVGFVAMAEPKIGPLLEQAAREPWRRVIVHPHLLFQGEIQSGIVRQVIACKLARPDQQWLVVPHLGSNLDPTSVPGQLLAAATLAGAGLFASQP